jgi:hypothetical protein
MTYAISGLPIETFQPLFGLSDDALAARNIVRHTAGADGRYPCRVSLRDAAPGDTLLLLNYEDHDVETPYRSAYAIYVNETVAETRRLVDQIPEVLRGRPIALRVFGADDMLMGADLVVNNDVEAAIERRFSDPTVAYIHAHNAAAGCFAARIDRG